MRMAGTRALGLVLVLGPLVFGRDAFNPRFAGYNKPAPPNASPFANSYMSSLAQQVPPVN